MLKRLLTSGLAWLWIALLFLLADRLSKDWVLANLTYLEPREVLPFFNLTLAYNTGAAFSFLHAMPGWQNWLFGGLAIIISLVVISMLAKLSFKQDWWAAIALNLVLAGAIGNAWDRYLYGFVIDFLDFHWGDYHFAIFNVADSAICVGAAMLVLGWLKQEKAVT